MPLEQTPQRICISTEYHLSLASWICMPLMFTLPCLHPGFVITFVSNCLQWTVMRWKNPPKTIIINLFFSIIPFKNFLQSLWTFYFWEFSHGILCFVLFHFYNSFWLHRFYKLKVNRGKPLKTETKEDTISGGGWWYKNIFPWIFCQWKFSAAEMYSRVDWKDESSLSSKCRKQ